MSVVVEKIIIKAKIIALTNDIQIIIINPQYIKKNVDEFSSHI